MYYRNGDYVYKSNSELTFGNSFIKSVLCSMKELDALCIETDPITYSGLFNKVYVLSNDELLSDNIAHNNLRNVYALHGKLEDPYIGSFIELNDNNYYFKTNIGFIDINIPISKCKKLINKYKPVILCNDNTELPNYSSPISINNKFLHIPKDETLDGNEYVDMDEVKYTFTHDRVGDHMYYVVYKNSIIVNFNGNYLQHGIIIDNKIMWSNGTSWSKW